MAGWKSKPLGEVCTIKPPKAEARAKLADEDEVSFAPMEDLGIGVKYLQPVRTRRLGEVSGSYTYFADGDVLLAKITPCFENGKLGVARGLMNGVGFGSSEYIVLRPAPTLDAEYLYYYLARPTFLEEGARTMTGAVGHKRVTKEFVESYQIPCPSVPEQRRIVAILDEAFEGIATAKANAEKNLRNAREVFRSHLEQVFLRHGEFSPAHPLEALTERDSPITYGVVKPGDEGDVAFVRGGDIAQGRVLIEQLRTIDATVSRQYRRTLLRGGELLISLVGQPGQVAVAPEELKGANIARQVGLIRLNDQIDAEYVRYYLQSPVGQTALGAKRSGSVQQVINLGELREVLVPIPGFAVQREAVRTLNAFSSSVERLTDLVQSKLAALDKLKKSLLQQAFTGALTAKAIARKVAEVA